MQRLLVLVALVSSSLGCQGLLQQRFAPPVPCPPGHPAPAVACPAPGPICPSQKIEVEGPETIIVRAPAPKVVIEQQQCAPAPQHPGFGGAPQNPGFGGAPQNPGFGAAPQGMLMPSQFYPTTGFGAGPGFVNGEVKERNSIGVEFTTVKIPFPWLRLRVTPQPSEITLRGQMANPGFGGQVVQTQGFGGVPMQGFGGMPMQQGFGGVAGGQMVYTGTQYVPVQGVQTIQVPTGSAAAAANTAGNNSGFGAAPQTESTADMIEKLKLRMKECEDLQHKLKSLQTPPPPGK